MKTDLEIAQDRIADLLRDGLDRTCPAHLRIHASAPMYDRVNALHIQSVLNWYMTAFMKHQVGEALPLWFDERLRTLFIIEDRMDSTSIVDALDIYPPEFLSWMTLFRVEAAHVTGEIYRVDRILPARDSSIMYEGVYIDPKISGGRDLSYEELKGKIRSLGLDDVVVSGEIQNYKWSLNYLCARVFDQVDNNRDLGRSLSNTDSDLPTLSRSAAYAYRLIYLAPGKRINSEYVEVAVFSRMLQDALTARIWAEEVGDLG